MSGLDRDYCFAPAADCGSCFALSFGGAWPFALFDWRDCLWNVGSGSSDSKVVVRIVIVLHAAVVCGGYWLDHDFLKMHSN